MNYVCAKLYIFTVYTYMYTYVMFCTIYIRMTYVYVYILYIVCCTGSFLFGRRNLRLAVVGEMAAGSLIMFGQWYALIRDTL